MLSAPFFFAFCVLHLHLHWCTDVIQRGVQTGARSKLDESKCTHFLRYTQPVIVAFFPAEVIPGISQYDWCMDDTRMLPES